ncbi:MAG: hypothetical protein CM15mV96_120 [uncultured marine virus]|nr:MAG: hypothetical protein CM15mV96_120 [uncultured marine virus]
MVFWLMLNMMVKVSFSGYMNKKTKREIAQYLDRDPERKAKC